MPEGPELRLMADYLNQFKNNSCYGTSKSDVTKVQTPDLTSLHIFRIAESRGKELILTFENKDTSKIVRYSFAMGMSGNWLESKLHGEYPKHSHFIIHFSNINPVCMIDPRRFAKWKIVNTWNEKRSPDPLLEKTEWYNYFLKKIQKPKYQIIPIYELLMDQELFNGVGNYIRAEVLFKMDIHPNLNITNIDINLLHQTICQVMEEAYNVGGSQISAFINPNTSDQPKNKGEWQQCYKKPYMAQKEDRHGRVFWYNPKWNL